MLLSDPIVITSRLLPGVKVGDATVSIDYGGTTVDGRQQYLWYVDIDGQEFEGDDLASGVGGGSLQEGLSSLFSFLSAFAESVDYSARTGRDSENADLFPAGLADWASENSDELSMLSIELEETEGLIVEN
jgi:hypothetical protein